MSEKEDFEAILTPAQQDRLVDTIETDLLIKPPLGRKFTKAAHLVLTNWANSHKSESRKEITAGLGYAGGSQLGRAVRRVNNVNRIFAGLDAGLDLAEPDYEYLQAVVLSMSQYNRMFLYAHYLKRPAVVAMLYRKMGQGDDEPKKAASRLRFSAVDNRGNIDINLVIPVSLLKLGQQIGDRFAPTLDGWDWNTLDLDLNLDTLHVRVSAE